MELGNCSLVVYYCYPSIKKFHIELHMGGGYEAVALRYRKSLLAKY